MLYNIIDYVNEYGKYSFDEMPFNEVDSLIFCQISYMNWTPFIEGIGMTTVPLLLKDIIEKNPMEELTKGYWFKKENETMVRAMASSERFCNLKLNYHVNIINEETQTQFCAMTFMVPGVLLYVAFRGTDATLVGWKEDLNFALSGPAHSQELAVEYLNRVASYTNGDFYVGGHSKGGNLAVYGAMFCEERTREKILHVYNHDGPGFRPEILEKGHFNEMKKKISKFIPKSSIVGTIMEEPGNFIPVESNIAGLLQHNSYYWRVEKDHFVVLTERPKMRQISDKALNQWIFSMPEDEVRVFVDTIYEVAKATQSKDIFGMEEKPIESIQRSFEAMKEVDETTRKVVMEIIKELLEVTGQNLMEEANTGLRKIQKIVDRYMAKR